MTFAEIKEYASTTVLYFGARVVGVIVLLIVGWLVAGIVAHLLVRTMRKANIDKTLTLFVSRLARWCILILFGLACLGIFGIQTTSFAAVIGAAGLAIGLAFQGALSNFAAGAMLLVFRPFKVGDFVEVAGQTGTVCALDLVTTAIDTPDNRRIVIPNKSVFDTVIQNSSYHPTRRVDVAVGTEYTADLDRTRQVLLKAVQSVPDYLSEPAPAIILLDLGPSSIDWSVRVWVNASDFGAIKQALIAAIKNNLDEAGIGIPFPQMEIHNNAITHQ
ncbi:MAG TPA: mechanosensitive ion channel [Pirellulales bacterium]|nr:mechanosensitive ion channel [Pirellulales bacterium]